MEVFLMLKSKKDCKDYEELIKNFDDNSKSPYDKDYNNVLKLYYHIKNYYKRKIVIGEIDIIIEKVRLEKNIGKYESSLTNLNTTVITGLLCIFIQFIFIEGAKLTRYNNSFVTFSLTVIMMYIFFSVITKQSKKDKYNDLLNYISLKVLEELEKEQSRDHMTLSEVAASKVEEDKLDEILNNIEEIKIFLGIRGR